MEYTKIRSILILSHFETVKEDTFENLRKFLESDDPAIVQMGLSMAKGSRVPDKMLGEILWMYMMHDDKTIRAAAKSTFMKIAPEDVKQAVKKNWKASYRTLLNVETISEAIHQLVQAFKSQDELNDIIWRLTEPIFKRVKIKPRTRKRAKQKSTAATALGNIGDARAVELLITALGHKEPLWAKMDRNMNYNPWGIVGSSQLHPTLGWRVDAASALGNIGDTRALMPLITVLRESPSPPSAYHNILIRTVKASITKCIKKLNTDNKEKKNILKFLKSKDPTMVQKGTSILKGILEE